MAKVLVSQVESDNPIWNYGEMDFKGLSISNTTLDL